MHPLFNKMNTSKEKFLNQLLAQVDLCNGQKPIMPGQKAAEGLFPVCIEVAANVVSPEKNKVLKDVSIYGFVKENDAGNSVLPNNPDFKSDAGRSWRRC